MMHNSSGQTHKMTWRTALSSIYRQPRQSFDAMQWIPCCNEFTLEMSGKRGRLVPKHPWLISRSSQTRKYCYGENQSPLCTCPPRGRHLSENFYNGPMETLSVYVAKRMRRRAASVVWPKCILGPFSLNWEPSNWDCFLRGKMLWSFAERYKGDHWTWAVFTIPGKIPTAFPRTNWASTSS